MVAPSSSTRGRVELLFLLLLQLFLLRLLMLRMMLLPLMLMPGTGSEIYRGLAAIIVGGMVSSAIFTLVLLPSLLRFGEDRHGIATNIPAPDADPARSGG